MSLGVHSYAVVHFPCLTKKSFKNRDFWVFAVTLGQISLGVPTVRHRLFSLSYEKILQKSRFWVFSVILHQISLGVHSHAVVYFPCLTKKSFKNRDFWVFAVTLGQISLGAHSHAVAYFPCLTKKSFKNRDFGSFRRYCVKFHSEYIRTSSFIFLVLRKNPSKIEILGLFGDTASNFTRSTFVRRRLFSDRATKCVMRFTFNTNFNLCHSSG